MTVLQALAARYGQLAIHGRLPTLGFAPAKISFCVVIDKNGRFVTIDDLRIGGKNDIPIEINAPQAPNDRRGEKIVACLLWDPSEYALGIPNLAKAKHEKDRLKILKKAAEKFKAFKEKNIHFLREIDNSECKALLDFLIGWDPSGSLAQSDEIQKVVGHNVTFRVEGFFNYLPQSQAVIHAFGLSHRNVSAKSGACLVFGKDLPIARLHLPIKGIGDKLAPLVSFNEEAFESYGKKQGFNAPVSEAAAFAYATALNALIAASSGTDDRGRPRWSNRIALGEDTVVFWVEHPRLEALARGLVEPPDEDDAEDDERFPPTAGDEEAVREKLKRIEAGEPVRDVIPDIDREARVYILGLSPNAARLSVRFWLDQSLGDLAGHIQRHWKDLDISPAPRGGKPKLWALLYEIAPLRKPDKGIQHLAGEMARAILAGTPYPSSLLTQALMRVRAEKVKTTPNRVSLIKAVLARQARRADPDWKDNLVALDRDEPNVGYRLGRLFAVLDAAQYAGIGAVNATVKDKFFAAASSTPGHIFPILLRGVQDHLSAARKKGKKGRAYRLDGEIREILAGIAPADAFPATLSREDQGRFVVGFYHQDADLRTPRAKDEEVEVRTAETDVTDSEDERE